MVLQFQARRSRHWKSRTSTKFEFTYPGEKNAERTCAALRNCSKGGASGFALRDDQFSSKHTERFHVERKQKVQRAKKQRNHRGESHILHAFREHDRLSVTRRDFQVNIARSVGSVGALTFVCKLLGLLREMMIAAKFGVGWVRDLTSSSHFSALILTRQLESSSLQIVDSHNQASVIPSFFLIAMGTTNTAKYTTKIIPYLDSFMQPLEFPNHSLI